MIRTKSKFTKGLSVFLSVLMILMTLPGRSLKVRAATGEKTTLSISDGSIVIGDGTVKQNGKSLTYNANGYIITGSGTTSNTISVTGGKQDITLEAVDVNAGSAYGACAFSIAPGASVNLVLSGKNSLISGYASAGLRVSEGASVFITGTNADSLATTGGGSNNGSGAGIGGDNSSRKPSSGNITITGGSITATGSSFAAGIGGAMYGSGGNIVINGGTVNATNGGRGAGIGGGDDGSGGNITISGGNVTATGNIAGAGIGGCDSGSGGNIIITAGTVTATGSWSAAGIGGGYKGSGGNVTISGGSVTATGGSDGGVDIGCDNGGSAGITTITGGSVKATSVSGNVTDGSSNNEYCVTTTGIAANTTVIGSVCGGATSDMKTDANGKLYFWMPATGGAAVKSGGTWYSTGVLSISGNTTASLSSMQSLDISKGGITIGDGTVTQTGQSPTVNPNGYVIAQSGSDSTTNTVSVTGGTHTIVLDGVDIDVSNTDSACAFSIANTSSVNLSLSGANTLKSGKYHAGLEVPQGTSLSITGGASDSLIASSYIFGAGIGGGGSLSGNGGTGGTITINGGKVDATGNTGIGGGYGGYAGGADGTITINGGTVTAQSNNNGSAGIGGSGGGSIGGAGGIIKITGGTVNATSTGDGFAGIGGGYKGSAGTTTITGGSVNANIQGTPTNGSADLYPATASVPTGTNVTALSIMQGGAAYGYGCKNMQADAASYGKLYLWLPADAASQETTADIATDSGVYAGYHGKGSVNSSATVSNPGVLKMDQSLTIGSITDRGSYSYGSVPAAKVSGGAPDIAAAVVYSGTGNSTQPTDVGNYTVTATKTGNNAYYPGKQTAAFTITSKDVTNDADLSVAIPDQTYTGSAITPSPTVKYGNTLLTLNTDYMVSSFSSNTNAAQKTQANPPTATVTFHGNYTGTKAVAFTIKPKDVSNDADLSISIPNETYTGSAIIPQPTVKDGNTPLTLNTDYTVSSCTNNISAAKMTDENPPTATVTFTGNYSGRKTEKFTINKKEITSSLNVGTQGQTYAAGDNIPLSVTISGAANQPAGTVTFICDGQPFASSSNIPVQTVSGNYTASVNWTSTAGTHSFKAVYNPASNGENYTCADAEIYNYTVGKKTQAALTVGSGTDYTVNQGVISKTFGDESFTLNVTGGSGNGGLSFDAKDVSGNPSDVVSADTNGKVTILKTGIVTITVTKAADATYNETAAAVQITVNPASQSGFAITDDSDYTISNGAIAKTFGDSAFTLQTIGGSGTGTVDFSSTGNAISVDQNGKVTIRAAGTSTVTATKAAQGSYMSASTSVTVNVGKAATSVTSAPAASDIAITDKLSASRLTGGSGSVAGSFAWTNPDTVVTQSGSYEATFTPSDTADYNSCTFMVNIAVTPILTSSQSQVSLDLTGVTLPAGVTSVSLGSTEEGSSSDTCSVVTKLIRQNQTLGSLSGLTVYDLKLLDQNGNPITDFTGKIKVKVPIPSGMSGNLKVFWYNPADGALTDMNAVQENGYLVFETSHFSYYAIAQLASASPISTSPVPNPKTGSGNLPLIPIAVLIGSAATGAVIIKRRRLFRIKKKA